jgi:hypothetical protein
MTAHGNSVSKHAAPIPVYLSERMTVARMLEALQQMRFNSREEGKVVLDRVVRNYLIHAAHTAGADPDQTIHQVLAQRGAVRR